MNLHTPERGANETREKYVARRAASNAAAKAMRVIGAGSHKALSSREDQRATEHRARAGKGTGMPSFIGRSICADKVRRDQKRMEKLHPLRDEVGAYTLTGRDSLGRIDLDGKTARRVWLAGISAQRGF